MGEVALDVFRGAGGWSVAARRLGIFDYGVELMPEANRTAERAGFVTFQRNVWKLTPERLKPLEGRVTGGILSPPCQTFSPAGNGSGRKAFDDVIAAIDDCSWTDIDRLRKLGHAVKDMRTALVLFPLYVAYHLRPRWLCLEQVPTVLPVWVAIGDALEAMGYRVWVGKLYAEQFGVPQTRTRAILIASLESTPVPPTPTHSRYYSHDPTRLDPGVLKWVSMAEALGWGLGARPSPTVTGGGTDTGGAEPIAHLGRYLPKQESNYSAPSEYPGQTAEERGLGERNADQPSFAVTSKGFRWAMPNSDRTEFDPTERPAPTVTGKLGTQGFRAVVRSTRGEPKDDPRNGHHTFDPAERPAHTVTTKVGDWEVRLESADGWVFNGGGRPNSPERPVDTPAPTVYFGHRCNNVEWIWRGEGEAPDPPEWALDRPATTVVGSWHPELVTSPGWRPDAEHPRYKAPGSVRVSVQEAAILQSFSPDYPWQGNKGKQYLQVGNAIPPLLAEAILRQVTQTG